MVQFGKNKDVKNVPLWCKYNTAGVSYGDKSGM